MDSLSDGESDSDSDLDSESEDSDEDESSPLAGFVETCVLSFTVAGSSPSESDELPPEVEGDEDSEEEATRLFLFLFRFLEVFVAAVAFTALLWTWN